MTTTRGKLPKVAFVLAAAAGVGGCCIPPSTSALAVTLHPQETGMWCWAASGQMVMEFHGVQVSQCTQANDRFGRNDCPCAQCGPNPVANPPCVQGGWPDFGRYGFTFQKTTDQALSASTLKQQLAQGRCCTPSPVAFTWHWNGGGGHMMVASGYQMVGDSMFVTVQDPGPPCVGNTRILTYSAYVSGAGYTHWDDYYAIHRGH